jgi:hypothetical protein
MKAEEANAIVLANIFKKIKSAAKKSETELMLDAHISEDLANKLEELGYAVDIGEDEGDRSIISW